MLVFSGLKKSPHTRSNASAFEQKALLWKAFLSVPHSASIYRVLNVERAPLLVFWGLERPAFPVGLNGPFGFRGEAFRSVRLLRGLRNEKSVGIPLAG